MVRLKLKFVKNDVTRISNTVRQNKCNISGQFLHDVVRFNISYSKIELYLDKDKKTCAEWLLCGTVDI